jgi:hypothetical protein
MTQLTVYSLLFIALLIKFHHSPKPILRTLRWALIVAVCGLTTLLSYLTALQYFSWATGSVISQHLLPPYQDISYFILYVFTEFWAGALIGAAIGLIGYLVIKRHAKQNDPFFYPEEPLLCLLAFLLVGHPLWIIYVSSLLLATLIGTLWTKLVTKTNNRVSFRYLWLPLAALTLLLAPILNTLDFFIYLNL